MIPSRLANHQPVSTNPAVFAFLAATILGLLTVLLFVFRIEELSSGVGWLVAAIAGVLLVLIMWNSATTAIILLVAGLAFHGVIMDVWGQGGSPIVHYWKEGFLIALGLITAFRRVLSRQRQMTITHSPTFIVACVYVAICCIRALFAEDIVLSMGGLAVLTFYFLLFLVLVFTMPSDKEISIILHAVLVIIVIVGLIGIFEKVFDFTILEVTVNTERQMLFGERRIYSTLGSTLTFASYMAIGVCITFSFLIMAKKWLQRLIYGMGFGICLIALSLSYTRGGYLQAGISVAVSGLLAYRQNLLSRRSSIFLFAVALLIVAGSGRLLDTSLIEERLHDFARVKGEVSNETRVGSWMYYYDRIMGDTQILLVGNGVGTASNLDVGKGRAPIMPESWVLKLTFEAGVFIMLLFYAMYFIFIRSFLLVFPRCPPSVKPLVASMVGTLAGLGIYSLIFQIFEGWIISMCLWLIAGMGCVLSDRYGKGMSPEVVKRDFRQLAPGLRHPRLQTRP